MLEAVRTRIFQILAPLLCLFILVEVNYPRLTPQSQLAIFAMLGSILLFSKYPLHHRFSQIALAQILDLVLVGATIICFGYIFVQSEPLFRNLWLDGQPLGNRAGMEQSLDYLIALIGLILILEATRRAIGWTLPLLSLAFLFYASFGPSMPDWLFPHRGYPWQRIASQTFLHSQGVFGIALNVMFTYVFLFVLFGTLLEKTGATGFIINFAKNLFRNSAGGPAKVAVLSSGLMGSLSGSAVANTATTGTFTIPMMKSTGFKPEIAAGVEAAASSGGALVPPIMGAGAYMMLEIISPPVTYLEVIKAALIPAVLYYIALLLIVHFRAGYVGAAAERTKEEAVQKLPFYQGFVFAAAFVALILFLILGYTAFRAVSVSMLLVLILSAFSKHTRIGLRGVWEAMINAAHGGVPLIAAAACVGIILGVVTLTGIGSKLPGVLLPLAQNSLILALLFLMISTIILGMGLPSAVCYLLVATLIGPVLGRLGLVPLAAHLFIFYFGMMSMVTPPVALAAYTAAAIAGAGIMQASFAAFRFALIGFALPFAFVLRPELLMLSPDGAPASFLAIAREVTIILLGTIPLAAGVAGFWFAKLNFWKRTILVAAALTLFLTHSGQHFAWQVLTLVVVVAIGLINWRERQVVGELAKQES